jgi:hypothetical protein
MPTHDDVPMDRVSDIAHARRACTVGEGLRIANRLLWLEDWARRAAELIEEGCTPGYCAIAENSGCELLDEAHAGGLFPTDTSTETKSTVTWPNQIGTMAVTSEAPDA